MALQSSPNPRAHSKDAPQSIQTKLKCPMLLKDTPLLRSADRQGFRGHGVPYFYTWFLNVKVIFSSGKAMIQKLTPAALTYDWDCCSSGCGTGVCRGGTRGAQLAAASSSQQPYFILLTKVRVPPHSLQLKQQCSNHLNTSCCYLNPNEVSEIASQLSKYSTDAQH